MASGAGKVMQHETRNQGGSFWPPSGIVESYGRVYTKAFDVICNWAAQVTPEEKALTFWA